MVNVGIKNQPNVGKYTIPMDPMGTSTYHVFGENRHHPGVPAALRRSRLHADIELTTRKYRTYVVASTGG